MNFNTLSKALFPVEMDSAFQIKMRKVRAGQRAGMTFLGLRAERAEIIPKKKQGLDEKTKIYCKIII